MLLHSGAAYSWIKKCQAVLPVQKESKRYQLGRCASPTEIMRGWKWLKVATMWKTAKMVLAKIQWVKFKILIFLPRSRMEIYSNTSNLTNKLFLAHMGMKKELVINWVFLRCEFRSNSWDTAREPSCFDFKKRMSQWSNLFNLTKSSVIKIIVTNIFYVIIVTNIFISK